MQINTDNMNTSTLRSLQFKHKENATDWYRSLLKHVKVPQMITETDDMVWTKLCNGGIIKHKLVSACFSIATDEDTSIEGMVSKVCPPGNLEHQKVKAIFNWICHNIEYDLDALKNTELRSTDPVEIFKRRKGVCSGYSCLFAEMCRVAGLECVKITGGCGENKIKGKSRHRWNAVRINKEWKLLDPTWAAGYVNRDRTKFFFKYDEKYFLTDPKVFNEDHFPDDSKWTLLPETNQVARGA